MFFEGDPYAGVDLDGCIDERGVIAAEARAIIERLDSYAEISPSGTGVKVWVIGTLPQGAGNRTPKVQGFKQIEMYDRDRFFAVTGQVLDGAPGLICDRSQELLSLHAQYFPPKLPQREAEPSREVVVEGFAGSDDELLEAARSARNGADFSALYDRGDLSKYGDDHSVADLALCGLLVFWCGPDAKRIDRLFSRSALAREKWNSRHDYRTRTIAKALHGRTEFYSMPSKKRRRGTHAAQEPAPATPSAPGQLILDPADPLPSARAFLANSYSHPEGRTLHRHQEVFLHWDGARYAELADSEVRSQLYGFLEPARRTICLPDGGEQTLPFQPTVAKVNNVQDALRAASQLSAAIAPPVWLSGGSDWAAAEVVAARNGLIHLPTERLIAHTPRFFCRHALPYDFDPSAPSPVRWRGFLGRLWEGDPESVEALQEWMGYTLTPDTSQQKILLIVGPPRSGKGTIGRVWTALLGPDAVAAPTLASLETNFGLWPLIGKHLGLIADARLSGRPDQAKIIERLLSISGEDTQTIDRKNMVPWTGRLGIRIVILTNELPRLLDSSGAMASRFIVLRLTRSFLGHEDPGLEATLRAELPGILRWALEGRRRLIERGHFVQPKSAVDAIEDLRNLSSPMLAFIEERCEVGPGRQVPMAEMYSAWCMWCGTQGRDHTGTVQTFGRDLKAALPDAGETRLRLGDGRTRCYTGVGLRPAGPQWSAVPSIARTGGGLPA